LLPVIREQLAEGGRITNSVAAVASWARYAEGIDEQGEPIEVIDQLHEQLVRCASSQGESPAAFIENRQWFGDLIDEPEFLATYLEALNRLRCSGGRATVEHYAFV
jgi:mannitol 2-dehydrogenase